MEYCVDKRYSRIQNIVFFSFTAISTGVEYDGKDLHVTMIPNPSHLEASHPVIMGKARSRYQTRKQAFYNPNDIIDSADELNKILTVQVHGDAAMAGQVNILILNCIF